MPTQEEIDNFIKQAYPQPSVVAATDPSKLIAGTGAQMAQSAGSMLPPPGVGLGPDIPGVSSYGAQRYTAEQRMWRAQQASPLFSGYSPIETTGLQEMVTGQKSFSQQLNERSRMGQKVSLPSRILAGAMDISFAPIIYPTELALRGVTANWLRATYGKSWTESWREYLRLRFCQQ